jgi:uncharacterized membrane protein
MYINIKNGLTFFFKDIPDQGYVYPNFDHGFFDPLSGILACIGLLLMLIAAFKKKEHLLMLAGFLFIWLFSTFVLTKMPNYARLLVILPFASFAVLTAIRYLSECFAFKKVAASLFVAAILALNIYIFMDFAKEGLENGNSVGTTARYMEARKNIAGYSFYLISDESNMYYDWGEKWQWEDWFSYFAGNSQEAAVLAPSDSKKYGFNAPYTVFMNQNVWSYYNKTIEYDSVHLITSDGRLVAAENLQ